MQEVLVGTIPALITLTMALICFMAGVFPGSLLTRCWFFTAGCVFLALFFIDTGGGGI
jgi:hypothetical protein